MKLDRGITNLLQDALNKIGADKKETYNEKDEKTKKEHKEASSKQQRDLKDAKGKAITRELERESIVEEQRCSLEAHNRACERLKEERQATLLQLKEQSLERRSEALRTIEESTLEHQAYANALILWKDPIYLGGKGGNLKDKPREPKNRITEYSYNNEWRLKNGS